MFFTIHKRFIITMLFITLCLTLCLGATVDAREGEQITVEQKRELADAFVEKIEYIYNYKFWLCGRTSYLSEDRYRKKALPVLLYWKNGEYYFIPVEDCNAETEIEGESRPVKYNEFQAGCYCLYALMPWSGRGRDDGNWALEYYASMHMEEMEELTYLGMVEIDTSGEEMPETERLRENGYISAVVDYLKNCGQLPVGEYQVYIGGYGYYDGAANRVWMTGIIKQNETYRWLSGEAVRNSNGSYEGIAYPANGAWESYPPIEKTSYDYEDAIRIVEAERLIVDLKVTEEKAIFRSDQQKEDRAHSCIAAVEITAEEAREKIEEVYNYYNWFYGDVPCDIGQLLEEGKTYSLFTDGIGNIFWMENGDASRGGETRCGGLYKSELQADMKNLSLYSYTLGSSYQSGLREIGLMNWQAPELRKPKLPPMVQDSYIRAIRAYISADLTEKGRKGDYQLHFGRYEILAGDIRSISVAVTGEETCYLHFLVTKDADGICECFPVGGSYMGEEKTGMVKADRIVQLSRLRMELELEAETCAQLREYGGVSLK